MASTGTRRKAIKRATIPLEEDQVQATQDKVATISTAITELKRRLHTFHWQVANFSIICPQECVEFKKVRSPHFSAGIVEGKELKWSFYITGVNGAINGTLRLHCINHGKNYPTTCMCKETSFSFSCSVSFGNSVSRFLRTHKTQIESAQEASIWKFENFITIPDLYVKKDVLLQEDTLHITVNLEIYGEPESYLFTMEPPQKKSRACRDDLVSDMKSLMDDGKSADVEIICGERVFFLHKLILGARSKVFHAMFNSQMKESTAATITLTDIDEDVFATMVRFIYTGQVILKDGLTYPELIHGAEMYELQNLKEYCFNEMLRSLTHATVGSLAVAAYTYNADPAVRDTVKKYCESNLETLVKIPEFRTLLKTHTKAILGDD